MGDESENVEFKKPSDEDGRIPEDFDHEASLRAAQKAARKRREEGKPLKQGQRIIALPEGMDPKVLPGDGWQKKESIDGHTIWERDETGNSDSKSNSKDQSEEESSGEEEKKEPPSQGFGAGEGDGVLPTENEAGDPDGVAAAEDIENNASPDASPDGTCVSCIGRGLAEGFAGGVVIGAILAILPFGWLIGAILFVAAFVDLVRRWDGMSWHEKQYEVSRLIGGGLGAHTGYKAGTKVLSKSGATPAPPGAAQQPGGSTPRPARNFTPPTNSAQQPNVPADYVSVPGTRGGTVYRRDGTTGNADTIRVMPPTQQYPNGYWRQYNSHGQPINPQNGRPGPSHETHVPLPEGGFAAHE